MIDLQHQEHFSETQRILHELNVLLVKDTLPQTILIYGNGGIGKSFVGIEASQLLLGGSVVGNPDFFHCNSKYAISGDEKKNLSIGIDEIRLIKSFANSASTKGDKKVVLIDSIDDMSNAAANTILKLAEEPQDGLYIICISQNINKTPATLRSRCFKINMKRPTVEEFITSLKGNILDISQLDKIEIFEQLCKNLYRSFNGNINDARNLLNLINIRDSQEVIFMIELLTMKSYDHFEKVLLFFESYIGKDDAFEIITKLILIVLKQMTLHNDISFDTRTLISFWEETLEMHLSGIKNNLNKSNILFLTLHNIRKTLYLYK